jgi:DNA-binding NarL/FixJ family response regulator
MFEQLLGALIEAEDLVEVVASAHTVKEGIEACRQYRPDVLLLDLALPDGSGLEAARALAKCRPDARIIIISGEADTFRCPPDLKQQVYSVIDKTRTFGIVRQELAGCLAQMSPVTAATKDGDIALLSPRETEVFRMIGRGLSTKEIAAAAFISPQTVETHRKKIAAKLGLRSSALVRRATLHELAAAAKKGR